MSQQALFSLSLCRMLVDISIDLGSLFYIPYSCVFAASAKWLTLVWIPNDNSQATDSLTWIASLLHLNCKSPSPVRHILSNVDSQWPCKLGKTKPKNVLHRILCPRYPSIPIYQFTIAILIGRNEPVGSRDPMRTHDEWGCTGGRWGTSGLAVSVPTQETWPHGHWGCQVNG